MVVVVVVTAVEARLVWGDSRQERRGPGDTRAGFCRNRHCRAGAPGYHGRLVEGQHLRPIFR